MNRNIDLSYELNVDSRVATIILNETYYRGIKRHIKEYTLSEYKNSADLYNQMLDDYNAEFDEELASMIDDISVRIWKEVFGNE